MNNTETIKLKAHAPNNKEKQIIERKRTGAMFVSDIVRQVKQGNIPSPFAVLQIKQVKKILEEGIRELEEIAKDDLIGHSPYIYGDYQVEYREGSRTVDYSEIPEIQKMEKHLKEIKDFYKSALNGVEKRTTILSENHHFVDQNGEVRKLPKWKNNKSSIVLTKVKRGES
jgi:hypothetical protein